LNQRPMVASVTDSPSVGTRISVMVFFLNGFDGHRPPCTQLRTGADDPVLRDGRDLKMKSSAYWMPRPSARLRTRRGMTDS
jgi:hypothetical protein